MNRIREIIYQCRDRLPAFPHLVPDERFRLQQRPGHGRQYTRRRAEHRFWRHVPRVVAPS